MKQPIRIALHFIFFLAALTAFAGNREPFSSVPSGKLSDIKMLSTFLTAANGNLADGNRVVFAPQYSDAVDGNDAVKMLNPGENFGLLRDNRILAVEARQPIVNGDTLFYNMSNLLPQLYRLDIDPENLATPGITCELVDRFLNTRKTISLTDSNHFTFQVTADAGSRATNRLIVVFSRSGNTPPFKFTGITATNKDNRSVSINWQVTQEFSVAQYEIERSGDNIHFNSLSVSLPLYNDQDGGNYQYNDLLPVKGDNFYRVRSVSSTGISTYSDQVKVSISTTNTGISIFPNPAVNHTFQVRLHNLAAGKYMIKLTNNSGQPVYSAPVNTSGNDLTQTIRLDEKVSIGNYNLSVWSEDGIINTQRLILQ